jgi:hypothetical protein
MAYIGNEPEIGFNTALVQKFNGDGACTQFTITQPISDPDYLEVLVNNVQQEPYASYSVASGLITFTEAPSVGANNIQVGMKSQSVVYYNQITSSQLVDGSIGGTKLIDGSVTGNKLGITAIRGNNIVAGQITSNLIATQAVTGNLIGLGAITGNNFAQPITGNLIGVYAISGNNIGTGAISANNFAGGGITSNVLSSNLSISVTRVSETININAAVVGSNSQSGTNVNLDIVNTTVYYFSSNTSGNVTFNLRGNNNNTFDSSVEVGNTVSVLVTLRHNTAAYRSGVNVMIDGGLIKTTMATPDTGNLIFYSGNTLPSHSPITSLESNMIGLNVIKKAANSYIVYMSNTLFGLS